MPYKISCPHCGGRISFEEDALGASVSCPHCQQPITLAAPVPTAEASTAVQSRRSSLLQGRWLTLVGCILLLAILSGAGVYLWTRYTADKLAVTPQEDRLTVGLVSFEPNKIVIRSNAQVQVTLHKDFSVPTIYLCDVTFAQQKPSPGEIDQIVRDALEQCIKKDATQEILAMAFLKDTALRPPDYSGPLVWKPEEKTIQAMEQAFK